MSHFYWGYPGLENYPCFGYVALKGWHKPVLVYKLA
jgi:hypothetical protein